MWQLGINLTNQDCIQKKVKSTLSLGKSTTKQFEMVIGRSVKVHVLRELNHYYHANHKGQIHHLPQESHLYKILLNMGSLIYSLFTVKMI